MQHPVQGEGEKKKKTKKKKVKKSKHGVQTHFGRRRRRRGRIAVHPMINKIMEATFGHDVRGLGDSFM